MKITLLFFGISRDIAQNNQLVIELNDQATVLDLKNKLFAMFEALKKYNNFSVAINEMYANDNSQLNNNDVVAIIPPVSGG